MIAAIYTGLLYGVIAGFSVAAFALTMAFLYGLIELVTLVMGVHQKYFTSRGGNDDYGGNR